MARGGRLSHAWDIFGANDIKGLQRRIYRMLGFGGCGGGRLVFGRVGILVHSAWLARPLGQREAAIQALRVVRLLRAQTA